MCVTLPVLLLQPSTQSQDLMRCPLPLFPVPADASLLQDMSLRDAQQVTALQLLPVSDIVF